MTLFILELNHQHKSKLNSNYIYLLLIHFFFLARLKILITLCDTVEQINWQPQSLRAGDTHLTAHERPPQVDVKGLVPLL